MKLAKSCTAIASLVHGQLLGRDCEIKGFLSTDSRSLVAGDIFFALVGERFDGHSYLQEIAEKGAALAIVQTPLEGLSIPQIIVADTLLAYGQAAGGIREEFKGRVFGITGSSGKTSCKEMLVAILAQAGKVHATARNNNNEVGVPLTLSQLTREHDFAVIEMGAGKPDDIGYLVDFAQPDIALVTNVGEAHLALFGSRKAIAATKKQIYNSTSHLKAVVVNGDEPLTAPWVDELKQKGLAVLSFGLDATNDVHATDIKTHIEGSSFVLCTPQGRVQVKLNVPGIHMVKNASASAAMAIHAGLDLNVIAAGLRQYKSIAGRLQQRRLAGVAVIDDSYNANPSSMRAAIDTLALASGRRVLVAGDMAELGPDAAVMHKELGSYARGKVDLWFSAGVLMEQAAKGFGSEANHFVDVAALIEQLLPKLQQGDTVLVKGSRSSKMERVIVALENHFIEGVA